MVIPGIYTVPEHWYTPLRHGTPLLLELDHDAVFFDSGADRPMEALSGAGSPAWNYLWRHVWSELGHRFPAPRSKDIYAWAVAHQPLISKATMDREARPAYASRIAQLLRQCGVDVLGHGGEWIVLNPDVIRRVSRSAPQANPAHKPHPDVGLVVVEPSDDLDAWQFVMVDSSTDKVLGYIAVVEAPNECGADTAIVFGAGAVKGWGPALYDTALEFARAKGWWLTADRRSITQRALPVWTYYMEQRDDVEHEAIASSIACPFYGVAELDARYRPRRSRKAEGPLAPDRSRKLKRMREIGDAMVKREAETSGTSKLEAREAFARRALAHFSEIYRNLLRRGAKREHAYSTLDVAVLAGMAALVGGTLSALAANPRTKVLKRRLLR